METNEIKVNEDVVMEAVENIAPNGSINGVTVAVGFGLGILAGGIAYKYVLDPLIKKRKAAKKKKKEEEIDASDVDSVLNDIQKDLDNMD